MGFIMYSAHTLQVHHLIGNVVTAIEREKGDTIKTDIQSKSAFHNEEDKRAFYKTYKGNDKSQRISHNHRKLPTIYCAPKYSNLLVIKLLSAFSSYPEQKNLTAGTHQRFTPAPGACLAYQLHRNLSAYRSDSGRISIIADRSESIKSLIPEIFHSPLSLDPTSTLHIYPFNIVANMPR